LLSCADAITRPDTKPAGGSAAIDGPQRRDPVDANRRHRPGERVANVDVDHSENPRLHRHRLPDVTCAGGSNSTTVPRRTPVCPDST
jgi:hypothetical protein